MCAYVDTYLIKSPWTDNSSPPEACRAALCNLMKQPYYWCVNMILYVYLHVINGQILGMKESNTAFH